MQIHCITDYQNQLYRNCRVQNIAAKVTLGKTKSESSKDCLMALHWLLVQERIEFKILTLLFKCIIGEALAYLMDMIQERDIHWEGLRSNSDYKSLAVLCKAMQA